MHYQSPFAEISVRERKEMATTNIYLKKVIESNIHIEVNIYVEYRVTLISDIFLYNPSIMRNTFVQATYFFEQVRPGPLQCRKHEEPSIVCL